MTTPSVPRRANDRRARRRDDVRDELLAAIQRLLDAGETFSRISIERLAAEAGMSRTRFYMYYEDKADLLHSAYMQVVAEYSDIIDEWWEAEEALDRAQLRRVIGRVVRARAGHANVSAAVRDAAASDPVARAANDELKAEIILRLQSMIERQQAAGVIDDGIDPEPTAAWLGWMIERGVDRLAQDPRPAHLRRVADAVTTVVWNTLYAPPAPEPTASG